MEAADVGHCESGRFVPLNLLAFTNIANSIAPKHPRTCQSHQKEMQLAVVDLMGDATIVDLMGLFFTLPLPSITSEDL